MTQSRILTATVLLIALGVALVAAPVGAQSRPDRHAEIFNTAATADTDLISADVSPESNQTSAFRLTIGLAEGAANSVLNVRVISGATDLGFDLNNGTQLTAGRLYTFTWGVSDTYTYNLQIETDTTIGYLLLEEVEEDAL